MTGSTPRVVFIVGLSSDIGRELGRRYVARGDRVYGTSRQPKALEPLFGAAALFPCDVTDPQSVGRLAHACRAAGVRWDVFIGAVGTEEPIGRFFDCDFDAWERAVHANALGLLRVLHALHPLRAPGRECACVLFSGAGTNNAAVHYSAYCASKIFLIKMCELLAAEDPSLNAVIVGPGIVRTKIHEQTLRAAERSGPNYGRLRQFLESDEPGVSHDAIFACVEWCVGAGHAVAGGRNFSLVYDAWHDGGQELTRALLADGDMYKLRRFKNAWRPGCD